MERKSRLLDRRLTHRTLTLGTAILWLFLSPVAAQGRGVPGEGSAKTGTQAAAVDVAGIAAGFPGAGPAAPMGCGSDNCGGLVGATLGSSGCGSSEGTTALSPLEGLSVPAHIYGRTHDLGGAPGLSSLGFLGEVLAGKGTVHAPSGELRLNIPLFKISGLAPGLLVDFRLTYRSYPKAPSNPGDPNAVPVRSEGGSLDIDPFGPGFRPFWGDRLVAPSAGSAVTRVDVIGTSFVYDPVQGQTNIYQAGGRGDRLIREYSNDIWTWYRVLPDWTRVEYGAVDGDTSGDLYAKRVFWAPGRTAGDVPGTWPLQVEFIYGAPANGMESCFLQEIHATRGISFGLTWTEVDTDIWRVTKITPSKAGISASWASDYSIEFAYSASGELEAVKRPPRDFLEDLDLDGEYEGGESFSATRAETTFTWLNGRITGVGRKAGGSSWTLFTLTYDQTYSWRVGTQTELGSGPTHTFTYNDQANPRTVTWQDPLNIESVFTQVVEGQSASPTKWRLAGVTRTARSGSDPRPTEAGRHATLTWALAYAGCACGRLESLQLPSGIKYVYSYDDTSGVGSRGLVTQVVVWNGQQQLRTWNYTYAAWDDSQNEWHPWQASRLIEVEDPAGLTMTVSYNYSPGQSDPYSDANAVLTANLFVDGSQTPLAICQEDRYRRPMTLFGPSFLDVAQTTIRNGREIGYNDYPTAGTDPSDYAGEGLPFVVSFTDDQDALSLLTDYTYGLLGWVTESFDSGGVGTEYVRDAEGRVVETALEKSDSQGAPPYEPVTATARNFSGKVVRISKLLKDHEGTNYAMAGQGGMQVLEESFYDKLGNLFKSTRQKGLLSEAYSASAVFETSRTYDSLHRLVTVTHAPGGQQESHVWDDQSMLYQTTVKAGQVEEQDVFQVLRWEYDEDGRMLKEYPAVIGLARAWEYDALGRRIKETKTGAKTGGSLTADGRYHEWVYGSSGSSLDLLVEERVKDSIDALQSKIVFGYDSMLRRTTVTTHAVDQSNETAVQVLAYNGDSTLLSSALLQVGQGGRGTYHFYDGLGREVRREDSLGATSGERNRTETVYGTGADVGRVVLQRTIWRRQVDQSTSDQTRRRVFVYDALGQLASEEIFELNWSTGDAKWARSIERDALGNEVWVEEWHGYGSQNPPAQARAFDAAGRVVATVQYGRGQATSRTYVTEYDDTNRTVTNKDPYDKETVSSYDYGGRLISRQLPGLSGDFEFTYDVAGRLTKRKDVAGNEVLYEYEAATGRLQRTRLVEGSTGLSMMLTSEEWAYDALDRERAATTNFFDYYDEQSLYPLTKAETTYDAMGRLTNEEYTYLGIMSRELVSSYDMGGGLKDPTFRRKLAFTDYEVDRPGGSVILPTELSFTPDGIGRIQQIDLTFNNATWALAEYGFEGPGLMAYRNQLIRDAGADIGSVSTFDGRGLPESKNHTLSSSPLHSQAVSWDDYGVMEASKYLHATGSGFEGTATWDWILRDAFGRAGEVKYRVDDEDFTPGSAEAFNAAVQAGLHHKWTYDLVNNWDKMEKKEGASWVTVLDPDFDNEVSDFYTSVENHPQPGENEYTYDANGFLISDGTYVYVPDYKGRLSAIYGIVWEGDGLSTSTWEEKGKDFSARIARTLTTRRKTSLTREQVHALVRSAEGKYGHKEFLESGVPRSLSEVSKTTSLEASFTLVMIAQYGYTPRNERSLRLYYSGGSPTSLIWASYDQGRKAEEYSGAGDLLHYFFEGVEGNEHLAQMNWEEKTEIIEEEPVTWSEGVLYGFVQDAGMSVVKVIGLDENEDEACRECIQYDVRGVQTVHSGTGTGSWVASGITDWGVGGSEYMGEVTPGKVYAFGLGFFSPELLQFLGPPENPIRPKGYQFVIDMYLPPFPDDWLDHLAADQELDCITGCMASTPSALFISFWAAIGTLAGGAAGSPSGIGAIPGSIAGGLGGSTLAAGAMLSFCTWYCSGIADKAAIANRQRAKGLGLVKKTENCPLVGSFLRYSLPFGFESSRCSYKCEVTGYEFSENVPGPPSNCPKSKTKEYWAKDDKNR